MMTLWFKPIFLLYGILTWMCMGLWDEHLWFRGLEEDGHKQNIWLLAWTELEIRPKFVATWNFTTRLNSFPWPCQNYWPLLAHARTWLSGYISIADAGSAGVIHFNGRAKPWLDIAFPQLRKLWTKYVNSSDKFIKSCHIRTWYKKIWEGNNELAYKKSWEGYNELA